MPRPKSIPKSCADCGVDISPRATRCDPCGRQHRWKAFRESSEQNPNPSGLCQCGCGKTAPISKKTHVSRGYYAGKPVRFIPGHNVAQMTARVRYPLNEQSPCWEWEWKLTSHGYAEVVYHKEEQPGAHKVIWEAIHGPLEEGMLLHHICENKRCVNPAHLDVMRWGDHTSFHKLYFYAGKSKNKRR